MTQTDMTATTDMTPADAAPLDPPKRPIALIFSALLLVLGLAMLDQTIVSTALPTIVGDLGGLDHGFP